MESYGMNGGLMADNSEFKSYFLEELKDIYWAEIHLANALPGMSNAATSLRLRRALENHKRETDLHVDHLERVFTLFGEEPKTKKCEAMAGLLKEAEDVISDTDGDSYTRDAGLILAAQKIEHYKIATYGTMRIFALHMGFGQVESIFANMLQKDKDTDVNLTIIAEEFVNECAVAE